MRHGHEGGEVTLGGRRVPVSRPRARTADGEREVELGTYAHFAARDQLTDVMLERMLAGVSTRRYARTGEPVGSEIDERRPLDEQVGGQPRVRLAHARAPDRAHVAARWRPAPGGGDARRDRAQGPLLRRRARDRHRRRQAPARAVGRLDRERHRRDHAAGQPRRARPGRRAGRARRPRRRQGAAQGRPRRASASTRRCSAASATRSETCSTTCPSATAPLVRRRLRAAWALDDHDRALDQLRVLADELARTAPRRGRLAARGHGRDADRHAARRHAAGSSARSHRRTRASR